MLTLRSISRPSARPLSQAPSRGRLTRSIGWNSLAQVLPMLVLLGMTPYLLHALGANRFGLWSLIATVTSVGAGLDGGIAGTLLRWFGLERANPDRSTATRLTVTALAVLLSAGVTLTAIAWVVAPWLASHIHGPVRLHPDAVMLFTAAPTLVVLALCTSVFNAQLQAHGRFRAIAFRSVASQGIYLALVPTLVPRHGLAGLVVASMIAQGVALVAAAFAAGKHLSWRSVGFVDRESLRELGGFAARVQLGTLAGLITLESDTLIVAAFLPVREVGVYAVGVAVATALRALPIFALPALYSELVARFDQGRQNVTLERGRAYHAQWMALLAGYGCIACACAYAAVRAWLGSDYATAGVIAAALALGNFVNLGTGVMSTVSRVLGRPGIETKYGLLSAAINIVLVVPFAWAFGIYGVLAATVTAQIAGSLWFARIFRRQIDPAFRFIAPELPIVPALLAAAGAAAATTAVAFHLPHGFLALTCCAALGAVTLCSYAAWVGRGKWPAAFEA